MLSGVNLKTFIHKIVADKYKKRPKNNLMLKREEGVCISMLLAESLNNI